MTAPHIVDPAGLLGEALAEASPDLMRSLLQSIINALLSADADAVVGAEWGQPSPDRTAQRHGYRRRPLDTRVGTIDVAVPKLRSGSYFALVRVLLAAGETVVDVASHLTAESRRRSTRRGKDDEGDAIAIARVALRESGLPVMDQTHIDADLKLLVDARDQLVQEEARTRNRLHALLLVMAPGYKAITGPLISRPAFARARSLALKARKTDPMRAKLALAAVRRLNAIRDEAADLETDINAELARRRPTNLLAIPGVGSLVAAKILGEVRDIRHYASPAAFAAHSGTAPIPASSGNTQRHRLARGGNRQLNRALFTIAMVQARWNPDARAYLARKRAEGKTAAEARRCLKRHLANVAYRALVADLATLGDAQNAAAA